MQVVPKDRGYFGEFGGRFVPETLMPALFELEKAYLDCKKDALFRQEVSSYLKNYVGRPSSLYFASQLTKYCGGAKIYLKREDLNHTGAHKINNTVAQVLLAKRLGKKRVIAETGAGQHGVATATAAALFGLKCVVYMGAEDIRRQELNVFRMKLLGSEVRSVSSGSRTLKDAMNEAIRDWVTNVRDTFYVLGSVGGPHPYPTMVRDFQSVIGQEARQQIIELEGRLPDLLIACVGGGSNAMGLFHPFLNTEVAMIGVEAAGQGIDTPFHAATLTKGSKGVLHGAYSYLLQDENGQVLEAHSISAGLDYPGVGPEHSFLKESGRVSYTSITDKEALEAFGILCRTEGIIPALESSHALAETIKRAPGMDADKIIILCLSGRGDKDVQSISELLEVD